MPITYRHFSDKDISSAQALTARHTWPLRAEDWRFMAQAGTGFVALDGDTVIGTALCWTYGTGFASLGTVTVSPAYRRRGLGRKLTSLVLEALGSQVTFLHASDRGRSLYERLGFRVAGKIDQHLGTAFQPPLVPLPREERLRPLGAGDMPRLVELAGCANGLDLSKILPELMRNASGIALDRDGELIGFSLFRRFGSGRTIGPVIAPPSADSVRAKALISHWLASNPGVCVRIDVPRDSGLSGWLETLGVPRVETGVTMVRSTTDVPVVDSDIKQFGIVNHVFC